MTTNPIFRRAEALKVRISAALEENQRPHPHQVSNGDEARFPNGAATFTKGLEHDPVTGVVKDPAQYQRFLKALTTEQVGQLDALPPVAGVVRPRKWVNPQAGLAFDLEGPDAQAVAIPAAPAFASAELAAETAEVYWMARLRDTAFSDYATDATAAAAATELTGLPDFKGPRSGGQVTTGTLFRGPTAGDLAGPYLSQFLLLDVGVSSFVLTQKQRAFVPGLDYMTTWADWLKVQNGEELTGTDTYDTTSRYIRNGRDLSTFVHSDRMNEAYVNAAYILLGGGVALDAGNPYLTTAREAGFVTFGLGHLLTLLGELCTRAGKAMWYQKWFVHRRLRPEAVGGRIERNRTAPGTYPIHSTLSNSAAVAATVAATGTALLPQAFPEGSPMHPSYGQGHAVGAGACVTLLKAWFDESFPIANLRLLNLPTKPGPALGTPRVPTADGTALTNYTGPDAAQLTVGGELDKLCSNIGIGRNHAGVHWYSDFVEAIKLGEAIAITMLSEQMPTFAEKASFTLTKFDGTTITI